MSNDTVDEGGVWVSFGWDVNLFDVRIWSSEIDALRYAQSRYISVAFVRYGESVEDADKRHRSAAVSLGSGETK